MEKWRERIATAVAEMGLPHKRVSIAAGLGPTFVRDLLERGQVPSVENLRKLAEYLGLRMDDLFAEESGLEEIGRRLRALRLRLSEGEDNVSWWVARLEPNITASNWIAMEKGFRRPLDSEIHTIIRRTGVTSDWILFGIPNGLPFHLAQALAA